MDEFKNETEEKPHDRPTVVRNATDLQRLKLEKLMKNPHIFKDKPIIIPEKPKERGMPAVPEFVRNVMGSSAGAGSGEFHVYRHLRRKEYARQKFMKERGERERLEDEYHDKLQENKRKAEEKTAKRRAKRLKRKGKMKNKKDVKESSSSESEEESESEKEIEDETNTNAKEETDVSVKAAPEEDVTVKDATDGDVTIKPTSEEDITIEASPEEVKETENEEVTMQKNDLIKENENTV